MQEEDSKERIENLAQFQEKAIKKAMTFKKAKEISYSTCSIQNKKEEKKTEREIRLEGSRGNGSLGHSVIKKINKIIIQFSLE